MSSDVGTAREGWENELWRRWSDRAPLILQPFRHFTYVTTHSPTLPLLHLRHSSFSNPSFASPTSQALHLRHLANRPCISTLVTKFSQNIVADTDKNKALIDSSFLSIVKSHPLKIPASVLEKVRSGSCLKLFLIDCMFVKQLYRQNSTEKRFRNAKERCKLSRKHKGCFELKLSRQ